MIITLTHDKVNIIRVYMLGYYVSVHATYVPNNFGKSCISLLEPYFKFVAFLFVTVSTKGPRNIIYFPPGIIVGAKEVH